MSNLSFYFLLITAVLCAALPGDAFAQGGEGGGFNGPTLSPVSIPIQVDRQVTSEEALAAMKVCFATGDARRGVMSLLDRAYESIFPGSGDPSRVEAGVEWGGFGIDAAAIAGRGSRLKLSMSVDEFSRKVYLVFNSDGSEISRATNCSDGPCRFSRDGNVWLVSKELLPSLDYDKTQDEDTYDQWGRVTSHRSFLQGVHVVIPGGARRLTFVNASTHRPVDLELNLDEYVQCLQGQVQQAGAR